MGGERGFVMSRNYSTKVPSVSMAFGGFEGWQCGARGVQGEVAEAAEGGAGVSAGEAAPPVLQEVVLGLGADVDCAEGVLGCILFLCYGEG